MNGKKIAVIGAGNMGGALITGLVRSGEVNPEQITAVDLVESILEQHRVNLQVKISRDARGVVGDQDIVILGIKPQGWQPVAEGLKESLTSSQVIVSIMAGVQIASLEQVLGRDIPVVRVMPNLLAQVRSAGAAMCPGTCATETHLSVVREMLALVGDPIVVEESQMDAVTGLSGSGPAYVYSIIDALADGGVNVGLSKDAALKLATQTVLGAAKMVLESGEHPAVLKDRVTSAGGTTIAGLHTLEKGGFRATLMAAVEAATIRSSELGG